MRYLNRTYRLLPTERQALLNAEEAIRAVLDYRRAHGLAIPPDAIPEIRSVTVAA